MIRQLNPICDPSKRKTLAAMGAVLVTASQASAMADPLYIKVAQAARELAGPNPTPLRIIVPQGSETNLHPIIKEFSEMTGIGVELVSVGVDEVSTELILDQLTQSGEFDLALPATFDLPDLVDSNAIRSLTKYAKQYEPHRYRDSYLFDIGDYFDGETYGFQTDGDAYVMFFNKDFLEDKDAQAEYLSKYGKPLEIPDTWAELDRQIAFFHKPSEGRHGATLFRTQGYVAWEFWVRLHAKGLWPFSQDMVPQINHPDAIAALEEMVAVGSYLVPEVKTMGLFDNWARFAKGDVYCNIGWGGSQKFFNSEDSQVRGHLVYAPTPGGIIDNTLVQTPYFNWGWSYVVTQTTTRPELSYLFALFASTPEISVQAVRAPDGFFDPFLHDHYEDPQINSTYGEDFLAIHQQSMENAIPDLYLKDQGNYFRVLGEQIFAAINEKTSAKEALDQVDRRWRLITNRAGRESQITRWGNLRNKYPSSVRRHLRPA